MKKGISLLAALAAAAAVSAQEPRTSGLPQADSLRIDTMHRAVPTLSDTAPRHAFRIPVWMMEPAHPRKFNPAVSMTSVILRPEPPRKVTVIGNNTLHAGGHFTVSNGQAWNWSPFPDAYLDARTLSFPMPR